MCYTCWCENCNCNETRTCTCPSFIGEGQVDIDTATEWVVKIFAPENNTVVSSDSSVDITETTQTDGSKEYDLSVTCCDKKVGACATDPIPSTLDNKLFVSAPLTKTVSNCSADWRITIWIDQSQLQDEKVKVDNTCSAVYLKDGIIWWNWIETSVDNCKVKIEINKNTFVKPFVKLMLSADAEVLKTHDLVENTENEWWFVLPVVDEVNNNWLSATDWIKVKTVSLPIWVTTKVIEIQKDWFYRVSFKFNCDINYGVHALRWCVFSTMDWKKIILDDKDAWESYGYAISQSATVDAKTDIWYSKQLSFWATDVTFLEEWTQLMLGGRLDPYVIYGNGSWKDWWIIVRKAWLDGWVIQGGVVTTNAEAWCLISVEWVSDENGWLLY